MKTKEFIKRVTELRYISVHDELFKTITIKHQLLIGYSAKVETMIERRVSLNTDDFNLIELCLEYAETPIERREEPKLYNVILPDSLKRGRRVYALGKLVEHEDEVIIQKINLSTLENPRCRLTEEEIKCNHAYLWQFAREVTK